MLQKAGKRSRTELLSTQCLDQKSRMTGVGARQRNQNPTPCPGRDITLADSLKNVVKEIIHQRQTMADPTRITPKTIRHLLGRPAESPLQVLDQKSLLHSAPGPRL